MKKQFYQASEKNDVAQFHNGLLFFDSLYKAYYSDVTPPPDWI